MYQVHYHQPHSEQTVQAGATAPPKSPMALDPGVMGTFGGDTMYSSHPQQHQQQGQNTSDPYWTTETNNVYYTPQPNPEENTKMHPRYHQQTSQSSLQQRGQEPPLNPFGGILSTTSAYSPNANFSVPPPPQHLATYPTAQAAAEGFRVVKNAPLTLDGSIFDDAIKQALEDLDYKICRIDSLPHFFEKLVQPLASENHYVMLYRWKETANVSYKMHLELMTKLPGIKDIETGFDRRIGCSYYEITVYLDPRVRRSTLHDNNTHGAPGATDENYFERLLEFKDERSKLTTFVEKNTVDGTLELRFHPRDEIDQKILSALNDNDLNIPPVMKRDLIKGLRKIVKANENNKKIKTLTGIKKKSTVLASTL